MKALLRALIMAYRYALSPWLGAHCRFYPSCSAYALEAIEVHGSLRGTLLAVWRLARCHPWHPGGFDPVPDCSGGHGPCRHGGDGHPITPSHNP